MKKQLLLVALVLLIFSAACGSNGGGELPTRVESVVTPTTDESPRIGPDSGLPATFTPAPTEPVPTSLPVGEGGTADTEGQQTYVVQPGDTLAEIAAAFGVTLDALVEANNIENIDVIEVGQVLIIP